jgi:hypothetical protein
MFVVESEKTGSRAAHKGSALRMLKPRALASDTIDTLGLVSAA